MMRVVPVMSRRLLWAHVGRRRAISCANESAPAAMAGRVTADVAGTPRRSRRGIILDLDDTLYPRERFVRSGFAAVAHFLGEQRGIPAELAYGVMTRASATGHRGREFDVLCERFGLARDVIPALLDVYRAHMPSLFLSAEVSSVLRRLRAEGWVLAVVTNGLPSVQFRKVTALGLASHVDEVVYAEEHAAGGKPARAPFLAVLRSLDLSADRCVCVGDDAARDVRGARALGIATVRLVRPEPDAAPAVDDEADAVIDTFSALPEAASLLLRTVRADAA